MIYFTADQHFGHANIITYCNRPFNSVYEMDEKLIYAWNTVVRTNDTVYHLGDFTLEKDADVVYNKYISKLNGKIYVVPGGHDKWINSMKLGPYDTVLSVFGVTVLPSLITLKKSTDSLLHHPPIVLSHYCMRVWDRSHYNSWHLFGHSHGGLKPIGKSHDVGVDNNAYTPVSLRQISTIMSFKENNENSIFKGV